MQRLIHLTTLRQPANLPDPSVTSVGSRENILLGDDCRRRRRVSEHLPDVKLDASARDMIGASYYSARCRRLAIHASRLYGPAPYAAKKSQTKEKSITVSPPLTHHQMLPLPAACTQK